MCMVSGDLLQEQSACASVEVHLCLRISWPRYKPDDTAKTSLRLLLRVCNVGLSANGEAQL